MMMNKFLYTLLLCSFLKVIAVQGQDNKSFRVGLKGGLNLSQFSKPNGTESKILPSYAIGVTLQQKLSQRVSINLDALYSKQGNTIKSISSSNTDLKFKYDYLILPISIGYFFKELPITIKAGVQAGFLLRNQYQNPTLNVLTVIPFLKKQDFGWLLSADYQINKHWNAEIKYYQSFSSILKGLNEGDPRAGTLIFNNPGNLKNQVLFFGLNYYF